MYSPSPHLPHLHISPFCSHFHPGRLTSALDTALTKVTDDLSSSHLSQTLRWYPTPEHGSWERSPPSVPGNAHLSWFFLPIIPSQPSHSGRFLYCLLMSIFPAVLSPVLFPLCRPKPLTYHPGADNFLIFTWVHFFPSPGLTCLCEHSAGNANARDAKMNPLSLQTFSSSCIPSLGKWTHQPSRPLSYTYMLSPAPPCLLHKFDVKVC